LAAADTGEKVASRAEHLTSQVAEIQTSCMGGALGF